jgi:folate-binding protein YgfZ
MNQQWKTLLESQSASINEQDIVEFSNAAPFPQCALSELSYMGLIRVSGEDAASFLQGQFSNDINALSEQLSQISCYCTPQGRMIANVRIFMRGGDYYLQLPQELLAATLKRLSMFILISKVELTDTSDQLVRIGLSGSCATDLLAAHFDSIPDSDNGVCHAGELTLLRLPADRTRFELIGPVEQITPLWQQLSNEAKLSTPDLWPLLDIRAGIATVYDSTSEAFIPQMTNMQLVDGISFTKGCYVGQEVVARMKYLGKLKRRMYRAHVATEQRPAPGDELYSLHEKSSGQGVGNVVDARPSPDGGYEMLVTVTDSAYAEGDLHLQDAAGPRLEFLTLPYEFESE